VSGSGRQADLLLVEPDPAEAELATTCFSSRVALARTGQEALRALEESSPRVVVLNPRLRDTDGLALLEQLRADPRYRTLPIVILSSDDSPDQVEHALRLGANSVVLKPIRYEALRTALVELESYWLHRHAAG
jgi:CheY-like chemotaxis protein